MLCKYSFALNCLGLSKCLLHAHKPSMLQCHVWLCRCVQIAFFAVSQLISKIPPSFHHKLLQLWLLGVPARTFVGVLESQLCIELQICATCLSFLHHYESQTPCRVTNLKQALYACLLSWHPSFWLQLEICHLCHACQWCSRGWWQNWVSKWCEIAPPSHLDYDFPISCVRLYCCNTSGVASRCRCKLGIVSRWASSCCG